MSNTYYKSLPEALPDIKRVKEEKSRLESCGVKYILSYWIDMFSVQKQNPFRLVILSCCAWVKAHSLRCIRSHFVPELSPADSDQDTSA